MLIAYRDYVQDSVLTDPNFTYTAGAPLSNLKDRRLAVVAREDGTEGGCLLTATFSQDRTIGIVALLNHQLIGGDINYVRGYDASDSLVFEVASGLDWQPAIGSFFPRHHIVVLEQNYTNIRKVTYPSTGPSLNGYFQAGRLWAGPVWRPEGKTTHADFSMATVDDSIVNKSIGQQVYVDYRQRYRRLTCGIPYMLEREAIGTEDGTEVNLQDIAFEVGRGGSVIVLPSTLSNQVVHKFGVYGHFLEPPAINLTTTNQETGRLYSTNFEVIEDL